MSNGSTKKGLSPLAWVGIGCGCLVAVAIITVVSGVGFAAFKVKEVAKEFQENPARTIAEKVVQANPDLDLISTDDETGTITFRDNKKDEEVTLSFEDLAEGKFSWTTSEGEFSIDATPNEEGGGVLKIDGPDGETRIGGGTNLDNVPDWVHVYPNATETQSAFTTSGKDGSSGALTIKTTDSVDEVMEYYKKYLDDQGYDVDFQSMSAGGNQGHMLNGTSTENRKINVVIGNTDGSTQIVVQYSE